MYKDNGASMSVKFAPVGESDLRSILRLDILHSIKDPSHELSNSQNYVSEWVNTFGDNFRVTVQFIVPIALPPNRKEGHCRATLDRVIERFLKISDGYTEQDVRGGWTDGNFLFVEKSIMIEVSVRLDLWAEIPPIMRQVIDDIQRDLRQKCVFVTVDNIPFGDPIDLLQTDWSKYPSFEEFGEVDPDCLERRTEGENVGDREITPLELTTLKIENQVVKSNSVSSNVAGGNVYNYNFSSGHNLSDIQQLIASLELNVEKQDDPVSLQEAKKYKEELEQKNVDIDPFQELRFAYKLVRSGEYDQAEGIYKKLLRKFVIDGNQYGIARVNYANGYLEMSKGHHKKAAEFHHKAYEILIKEGYEHWANAAQHQLGNCMYYNYDDVNALAMFKQNQEFELEIGDSTNVFTTQFMIGTYSVIGGNFAKGRRQLKGCLNVFQAQDSEWHIGMQAYVKETLAWIDYFEGNIEACLDVFEKLLDDPSLNHRAKSCIHAGLGRIYIETGEYAKAEQNHRECVRIRLLQGARIGDWYEKHQFTDPNADWNYPPEDLSEDRYDMMWPK
jgi:tetratricopeptide (TPR) repeat protein